MSMPMPPGAVLTPPGFLSPAAFPYPNGPYPLANDAPPLTPQPYFVGETLTIQGGTSTAIPVQNPTGRTDAIIVSASSGNGGAAPVSCTDTQGNFYALVAIETTNQSVSVFVAQNTNPLTAADTITITRPSGNGAGIVIGCPLSALGGSAGFLTYAMTSAVTGANSSTIRSTAPYGLPQEPALVIAALAYATSGGAGVTIPQGWNVLATGLFAAVARTVVMYQVTSTPIASGQVLANAQLNAAGGGGLCAVVLIPETRFATQPGIAQNAAPAPPGLMSPGAWPVLPPPPQAVNDAPPTTPQPYLVAQTVKPQTGTTTVISVQNPTSRGDAIIVSVISAAAAGNASCADTQGNTYSLAVYEPLTEPTGSFIAQNTNPLTAADTITVTWPSSMTAGGIVIGVPSSALGPGGGFLTYAMTAAFFAGAGLPHSIAVTAPYTLPQAPVLVMAVLGATLAPQNVIPQGWTVLGTAYQNTGSGVAAIVMYQFRSSAISAGSTLASSQLAGQGALVALTLIPETRFAPKSPPDMPPGMQSPGAWQYAPLHAPEGPASTKYASSPYKWTETLPAVSQSAPAVVKTAGKLAPATPHPTGKLVKATGKSLTATPHPAGKLAKATAKSLTAAVHSASVLGRSFAALLAAAVRSTAKLLISAPAPVFSFSPVNIGQSQLSTQYVPIPLTATRSGKPYNPTADVVQFAFMPVATQVPKAGDWVTGRWDTDTSSIIYPYQAKCFVGPSGAITLGLGTYIVFLKVFDPAETPVFVVGQLQIQ